MLNNKGSRLRFKENNFQSVSHKNSKKERKGTIGSNSRKDSSVRLARATAWKKEKKTMQVSLHSRHSARNLDERFEARWKPKAREKGDWGGRGEKRDSYSEQICRRASYFSCERTASCSSELSVIILYLDYRTALGNSPSCERDPFTSTPPPILAVRLPAFSISRSFRTARTYPFSRPVCRCSRKTRRTPRKRLSIVALIGSRKSASANAIARFLFVAMKTEKTERREVEPERAFRGFSRRERGRIVHPHANTPFGRSRSERHPVQSAGYYYARALHKPLISSIKYYPNNERSSIAEQFTIGGVRQRRKRARDSHERSQVLPIDTKR